MRRVGISAAITGLSLLCGIRLAAQALDCATCHEQSSKIKDTAHATLGCVACHPKHETYPHPAGVPRPACAQCHKDIAERDAEGAHGQARRRGEAAPDCGVCHGDVHQVLPPRSMPFRQAVVDTCGLCHSDVVEQYRQSVHGIALQRGIPDTPLCTDCHGEHSMLPHTHPASLVHRTHIRETCGRCHGDVRLARRFQLPADRVVSYEASFHGLAAKAGSQTVANCASCHGYHNILPSSDPRSMTHPKNLAATCGQCHPGAGKRFAIGRIHWVEGEGEPTPVRWARVFYLTLIPLTIGLMLLHNGADWIRKLWRLRFGNPGVAVATAVPPSLEVRLYEVRMHRFERIQHALLVVSFAVLVWTGFALKYSDQWWARPLVAWEHVFPVRATVHRVAGVVLIAVAVMHVISLVVDRNLRRHWKELMPRAQDAREALHNLAWLLGLRRQRPILSRHSYVEKAEYWAVVWGTAIMAITGIALWATDFMLAYLPKVWLDFATTVHFYEAVLATLAIVVWHFYAVIFDPEVYPMDPAWLTGRSVRRRPQPSVAESDAEQRESSES
ncbi:MAG: cytochrome b/b6 domain-containing protein [Bryobacterales bacterium]|nr:cytochrome b/b6 domain-containing protein [Bryobacteraceae bacterium]MDW8354628.1 cytochrome b/b6 domain-containing protein [Bryobacterales bacterium]